MDNKIKVLIAAAAVAIVALLVASVLISNDFDYKNDFKEQALDTDYIMEQYQASKENEENNRVTYENTEDATEYLTAKLNIGLYIPIKSDKFNSLKANDTQNTSFYYEDNDFSIIAESTEQKFNGEYTIENLMLALGLSSDNIYDPSNIVKETSKQRYESGTSVNSDKNTSILNGGRVSSNEIETTTSEDLDLGSLSIPTDVNSVMYTEIDESESTEEFYEPYEETNLINIDLDKTYQISELGSGLYGFNIIEDVVDTENSGIYTNTIPGYARVIENDTITYIAIISCKNIDSLNDVKHMINNISTLGIESYNPSEDS